MRRTTALAVAVLLVFAAACTEVEEIVPLLYPGGEISDPSANIPDFQPAPAAKLAATPSVRGPSETEARDALARAGLGDLELPPEAIRELARDRRLVVDSGPLHAQSTYQEAYHLIFRRGWTTLWTTDALAERYFTLYEFIGDNLARRQAAPSLQRLLREMIHTSLEQYHYSVGDLKEAAWRNTAYLCVAARILDPDAPTPFIVSGIVRQELDRIQAADGEARSPLLGLDATTDPCAGTPGFGCLDYALFREHPFVRFHPDRRNLHQALLWLSEPALPLRDKLPFLQAVLLTDCVKRTQIRQGNQELPAWRSWLAVRRLHTFLHRTEPCIGFPEVDAVLRGTLPESFDENYFLNPAKLEALEREQPGVATLRSGQFRFFPRLGEELTPYLSALVYPAVGPDTTNPLYAEFLLPNLSANCSSTIPPGPRRRLLSCAGLTPSDLPFLLCNASRLAFQNPRVMEIFRLLPSSADVAATLGWPPASDATPTPAHCQYVRNLARLQRQLRTRPDAEWGATLADLTVWQMRPDPSPVPRRRGAVEPARPAEAPLGLLVQLCPAPVSSRDAKSAPDRTRSMAEVQIEAAPAGFHRLAEATEHIRHYLMMTGYSDLILDDILLQYSTVAERLEQLAAVDPAGGARTPAQTQYLQTLDQRLDLLESRLLGYFPGEPPAHFHRTVPRWSRLAVSADSRTQRVGILGGFRLRIELHRVPDGWCAGAGPQPGYFEMESSAGRFFSQREIAEFLRKRIPKPVD